MSDERPSEVRPGQRIAKAMARAGLCSRRDAEAWIAAGRVTVNGKALDSPAHNVTEADDVRVDGEPLAPIERTRLFLFHKPRGLVTTARDPEGRPTIFEALPAGLPRLVAVGRLDINTEGLLLLTNDGGLARVLELPSTGWLRRYRVRAHGTIDQARLNALREGVTVDGVDYAGMEARLDREQGSNVWLTMGLREGKNREVKKVLDQLGLVVNRLIRVSFGPFELADLGEGDLVEVRTRVLRDQLGPKLAKEAGANFHAPILDRPVFEPEEKEAAKRRLPARERPERGEAQAQSGSLSPAGGTGRAAGGERLRRGPPRPSAPERKRKHVSALRAEIAADAGGPRKRIERSATRDRRGRSVAVERRSPVRREANERIESDRRARKGAEPKRGARPRGFDAEVTEERRFREQRGPRQDAHQGRKRGDEFVKRRSSERRGEGGQRPDPSDGRGRRSEGGKPRERDTRRAEDPAAREDRRPDRRGKPHERAGRGPTRGGRRKDEGPRRPPRKR